MLRPMMPIVKQRRDVIDVCDRHFLACPPTIIRYPPSVSTPTIR